MTERLLHLLVERLGGYGCWMVHPGDVPGEAFNGFSLGNSRNIRLAEIAAAVAPQITDTMVETAAAAIDAEWADEPNRDPPFDELDVAYKNHCRATARAALEAVFGATEKT